LCAVQGFSPVVRAILDAAPEDNWKQFAMFSGPELSSLTEDDTLALIGDASHRK
jgi:salicylate hydroxylase